MAAYDHFKENPGFKLWNVVTVQNLDNKTWLFDLINREKDEIAVVQIRKMSLAALQKHITDVAIFYCARDDTGITVINKNEAYITSVSIYNASQKEYEDHNKHFEERGLSDNEVFKMGKREREFAIEQYNAWKALPQTPLENPITSFERRKCYYGLPINVYMHLVGHLCTHV